MVSKKCLIDNKKEGEKMSDLVDEIKNFPEAVAAKVKSAVGGLSGSLESIRTIYLRFA